MGLMRRMKMYGEYEQVNGATVNRAIMERDQLVEEVKALRDALRDCAGGLRYIRQSYGELYGVGFDRALGKADALLK